MATHREDWACTICCDDFPASEEYCKIPHQNDKYHYDACAACLQTQFLSAKENEMSYPVKWQKKILHPRQCPGAVNQTFVRAYESKEVEYKAPPLKRAYCECGMFVAPIVSESAMASWLTLASSKLCPGCEARWCLRCAQRCRGFGVPHECIPERMLGERRLAFGGLKKGKDFQICPGQGCGRTIELADACNAMTCQCGTNFCYICGEQAEPESEHWLRADDGCPRYGAAGNERAMFDDDFDDADDDANENVNTSTEIWERGQGESTTFEFIRYGDPENEAQRIDEVRRIMEMYNSISLSGVSGSSDRSLSSNTELLSSLQGAFELVFGVELARQPLCGILA